MPDNGVMKRHRRPEFALTTALLATLAMVAAGCSDGGNGGNATTAAGGEGARTADVQPLRLTAVSVHEHLHPKQPITLRFNEPLARTTPHPTLQPAVPGTWTVTGSTLTFQPTTAYPPQTKLTLTVPSGEPGLKAANGGALRATRHRKLITPTPRATFAEQILARLDYLPVSTSAAQPSSDASEALAMYRPPHGHFSWRWSSTPATLRSLWSPTQNNTVLRGAVLAFQHVAGITADGLLGPHTWKALLAADRAGRTDPSPYTYITAVLDESPQTLTVWKDGHTAVSSPVNGGVAGAPTPVGTFPIYERLSSTTMSGTNPDGSHYSDPGVPWVNYFSGGSAVHGFPRASYGSPQSVGCLELPIGTADTVWHMVDYGTLVTVINTYTSPVTPATPAKPSPTGHATAASHPTHSSTPTHTTRHSAAPKSSPSPSHKHR